MASRACRLRARRRDVRARFQDLQRWTSAITSVAGASSAQDHEDDRATASSSREGLLPLPEKAQVCDVRNALPPALPRSHRPSERGGVRGARKIVAGIRGFLNARRSEVERRDAPIAGGALARPFTSITTRRSGSFSAHRAEFTERLTVGASSACTDQPDSATKGSDAAQPRVTCSSSRASWTITPDAAHGGDLGDAKR